VQVKKRQVKIRRKKGGWRILNVISEENGVLVVKGSFGPMRLVHLPGKGAHKWEAYRHYRNPDRAWEKGQECVTYLVQEIE